ncbi:MAG: DUF4442 domain-containing protein [Bacteroidetes bacterium]|nr:DUF4442 domain-containing protein [Bacteroidota bacterium]
MSNEFNLKKANRMLFWFGIFKIPMIGFTRPKIVELTDQKLVLKIPFNRRTKNHLNSLYIAGFTIGADLATGFLAYFIAKKLNLNVAPVFKSFKATYLKRSEFDTYFICDAGQAIKEMVLKAQETQERQNMLIKVDAVTRYPNNPELVADCEIELSLKGR